jgi:signal transduction histidine kinase
LLSIITDTVNIATIEAGQEVVDEKPTNVNEVCKYLYGKFNQNAVMTDIAFSYHAPLEDIEVIVQADELKLRIVLDNLINNAFKFTPEGSIKFGYMLKDDMLEFWVKDNGIGISPDKQADIFKRFQQGNNEASRIYGGSGLGLSIAKAYVELMGGAIKVVSAPGQGSTFLFTIPYKK